MTFELNCINFSFLYTELEGGAVQMVELYCKSLPLSKDLDPQESLHGEELLSMVCNLLVQVLIDEWKYFVDMSKKWESMRFGLYFFS